MKIYRVHSRECQAGSTGYTYHTSKRAASRARQEARQRPDIEDTAIEGPYDLKLTKAGVLAALERFGGHPDNG